MADDLIERLERARTDFWAHTRMDCLREAADALASKDAALSEIRAELERVKARHSSFTNHVLTTLRSKSHSDIDLEIEAEAWFRDAAMWKERAEAAEGELAEFRQAAESQLEMARKALQKLANEVGGLIAFEPEVRQAIGNTNWTVLQTRLGEADTLLSAARALAEGETK